MSKPKISIIIPVYNVEEYLAECLDSCVNQTLRDIEIICVDDCSSDSSYKILEGYRDKDPRIRIFRQEQNRKQGAARNRGLKIATGEYVWFVDSDDYIDTKACQILYDAIKDFNVDILCFSAIQFTKNRIFSYPQHFQGVQINKIYHPKTNWKEINFSNLNVVPWAYLSKKSIIQEFQFRENVFFEDTDFSAILLASVNSFCFIPYSAYFRRINSDSTTQTPMSQKKLEDCIALLNSLDDFVKKNKISEYHFLYKFLTGQIDYIFELCNSIKEIKPNNLDMLMELKIQYRRPKHSLKRFTRKMLNKLLGDFE
ncbi:glycosyltransferase family 2 protein [bacterium]|nr:glycosyltransferase family 2 protein [bacterium]